MISARSLLLKQLSENLVVIPQAGMFGKAGAGVPVRLLLRQDRIAREVASLRDAEWAGSANGPT